MFIKIISDLHQEFGVSILNFNNADLVILAGDTNLGIKGIEWVKKNIPNRSVIFILGNHEHYKGAYPKTCTGYMAISILRRDTGLMIRKLYVTRMVILMNHIMVMIRIDH